MREGFCPEKQADIRKEITEKHFAQIKELENKQRGLLEKLASLLSSHTEGYTAGLGHN